MIRTFSNTNQCDIPMNLIVLIDNQPHPSMNLETEHGLCIFFEIQQKKFLLDTGASPLFAKNAAQLGVDIAKIDYLILSHSHMDHTGGLETFLKLNHTAPIYLSEHVPQMHCFSARTGIVRDISISHDLLKKHQHRFIPVSRDTSVSSQVHILCPTQHNHALPFGNRVLFANDQPDDFRHEIAVSVETPQGTLLLSSCSHHGILNTLNACPSDRIIAYIGGTHLIDSQGQIHYEKPEQIQKIAQTLYTEYPQLHLYTGHCTGLQAQEIFSNILGDKFTLFYSGFSTQFQIPDIG